MDNSKKKDKKVSEKDDKVVRVDIRTLPKRRPKVPSFIIVLIFSLILSFGISILRNLSSPTEEVSISEIITDISEEKYDKIILKDDMVLLEIEEDGEVLEKYALLPPEADFYQILSDAEIDIKELGNDFYEPNLGVTLGDIITFIFFGAALVLVYIMIKNMQGSGGKILDFGQSKARLLMGKKTGVTFEDVAGIEEAKEELTEIVEYLKNPKKFEMLGGRIPKGVLLVGRPGTGKTLLAKAVAGEANVPFFSVSGSDFVEMFVGVGASRVRDLFAQAKKNAPAIAFIDELDAVGRHRGSGVGGGHDEREQTLNQLLVEMDGFEINDSVIIIAATNRPDVLDPALLRPGRFDRQVIVDLPDINGRTMILQVHSKKVPLSPEVNLKIIARATPGFSGAELANLVNEAALIAARSSKKFIEMDDFEEAKDKLTLGKQKKSKIVLPEERKITSYHEIGHVICALFEKHGSPAHKVSIIPRGMTGGATHFLGEEKSNYSKSFLKSMLVHLLGGRAAEDIVFDEITTGASNDIDRATDIVKQMVCNWGMSKRIGPLAVMKKEQEVFLGKQIGQKELHSEEVAKIVDSEIHSFIDEAYKKAKDIITNHRDLVDSLADELLDKETLSAEEIFSIVEKFVTGEDLNFVKEKYKKAKQLSFELLKEDHADNQVKTAEEDKDNNKNG